MVFNPESLKSGFSVEQIALLTTQFFYYYFKSAIYYLDSLYWQVCLYDFCL